MGDPRDVLTEEEAARVAEVFETHQGFIQAVASRYSPTPAHIPDVVQAVGVVVCRHLNGFRSESALTTWLYRVTKNEALQMVRRENRQRLVLESVTHHPEPDVVVDPDERVESRERRDALYDAIDQLPDRMTVGIRNELAGSSILLSRWTRHRARRRLREMLEDDPRVSE